MQPGIHYRPVHPVKAGDLFNTVHRIGELKDLDGRAGDKKKRIEGFVENHQQSCRSMSSMSQAVSCSMFLQPLQSRKAVSSNLPHILHRLRDNQQKVRVQAEKKDSALPDAPGSLSVWSAGVEQSQLYALPLPPEEMQLSPSKLARKLISERLPAPADEPGVGAIPADQYHACILAISPLHLL